MIKIKITYNDLGKIKAKIINIFSWYDLTNDVSKYNIYIDQIIKIERIMEADEKDIEDLTKNNK